MLDSPTISTPPMLSSDVDVPQQQQAFVPPVQGFVPFASEWLERSLPARFEDQVARYPNSIALQVEDRVLTYQELNHCANRLAHALLQESATTAAPITVLLADQIFSIVALLAILKSGNCSVFVDPTKPRREIAAILNDTQATCMVTDQAHWALADAVAAHAEQPCQLLQIDTDHSHFPTANLERVIPAESYAQIVYTSGSTGKPKGVIRTHAMLLRLSMAHANSYYITPQDRMMAPAPILFGSSLAVVVAALLNGATLLPFDIRAHGTAALAAWLRRENVTIYHSVASVFRHFLTTISPTEEFPAVRVVKLGGEAIYRQDINLYKRHFSDNCIVRVGLASTETNAYSWYFLDKTSKVDQPVVPVGYILPEQEVLIWDEDRQPVGPHEVGEIVVRSRYLAPGYWRNPELTAAKFLPDPAGGDKRIYLTGDLGRMRPDGMLEHLGRKDQMVKVRGYRVELAAIEGALLELPGVCEAAVIAVDDAARNQRLVAYLVPHGAHITIGWLRNGLQSVLPDYMIPTHFVMLDELPLLPSGKVDRKALPEPKGERPTLGTPLIAPRTPIETQLAAIWQEILHVDRVGIRDDFFALGGHSLTLMNLLSQTKTHLGQEIAVPIFLQEPTIEKVAAQLQIAIDTEKVGAKKNGGIATAKERLAQLDVRSQDLVLHYLSGQAMNSAEPTRKQKLFDNLSFQHRARLFTVLCRYDRVQKRFFREEHELLHRFLEAAAFTNLITADMQALYAMRLFCKQYGRGALARALSLSQVCLSGQAVLTKAGQAGNGILLLGTHTLFPSGGAVRRILQQLGYDQVMQYVGVTALDQHPTLFSALQQYFGDEDEAPVKTKFLSGQLDAARRQLIAGGIVRITADGSSGGGAEITLPILGRLGTFKTGFAELALSTGATVIPVNTAIEHTGQVKLTFRPPLTSGTPDMSHEVRVALLMKQYVAFLEENWRADPANIHLEMMKRYLTWSELSSRS